ncbi:MAG: helix-turn-helix transcriptional regulator [Chloroflexi bacterium]|nr:helix-turn-helix transcriptional regulator [Chloroflexota bacterium]
MAASDSSQLIVVSLIAALSVVYAIWTRIQTRRRQSSLDNPSVKIVSISPDRDKSERLSLWNNLSVREKEIARLASEYWSDDEIARDLHLSVRTVQNHLQHAREKLHIHSRHEFKYFVQQLGVDSEPPPRYG